MFIRFDVIFNASEHLPLVPKWEFVGDKSNIKNEPP